MLLQDAQSIIDRSYSKLGDLTLLRMRNQAKGYKNSDTQKKLYLQSRLIRLHLRSVLDHLLLDANGLIQYPIRSTDAQINQTLRQLQSAAEINKFSTSPTLLHKVKSTTLYAKGDPGDIGPTGPIGPTGLATDISKVNVLVGTTIIDTFAITSAKAARWDYVAVGSNGSQRASSIIGHWKSDGSAFDLADWGADDVTGSTSGIEFSLSFSGGFIQLIATVTSLTWEITGTRYFIPNNGNGTGPVSAVLPNNQVYIGNVSNVATPQSVTGDIAITNTGVTSINAGVILDADINSSANITLTKLSSLNNNIVPITNGSGKLISSTLNPTTLGFVDISSSLTSLLNAKLTDPMTNPGDIIIRNGSNITTRLGAGANGQVLTLTGGVPTWQNASGGAGLSGLATNFLTKAATSTTVTNSTVSEIGGAVLIPGTLEIQGGFRTEPGGSFFKIKEFSGTWNMDNTITVTVFHGVNFNNIAHAFVMITNNSGLNKVQLCDGGLVGGGGRVVYNSTSIFLERENGGYFDTGTFSAATYKITLLYTV